MPACPRCPHRLCTSVPWGERTHSPWLPKNLAVWSVPRPVHVRLLSPCLGAQAQGPHGLPSPLRACGHVPPPLGPGAFPCQQEMLSALRGRRAWLPGPGHLGAGCVSGSRRPLGASGRRCCAWTEAAEASGSGQRGQELSAVPAPSSRERTEAGEEACPARGK